MLLKVNRRCLLLFEYISQRLWEATSSFGVGQRWDALGSARCRFHDRGLEDLGHDDPLDGAQIIGMDICLNLVSSCQYGNG